MRPEHLNESRDEFGFRLSGISLSHFLLEKGERERVQGEVMEKEAREFKTHKPLTLRLLSNAIKTHPPPSISYAISLERQVRRERKERFWNLQ